MGSDVPAERLPRQCRRRRQRPRTARPHFHQDCHAANPVDPDSGLDIESLLFLKARKAVEDQLRHPLALLEGTHSCER